MADVGRITFAPTQGPWHIDRYDGGISIRPAGTGYELAHLSAKSWTYTLDEHNLEANARLIAAAPDLLAALKEVEQRINDVFATGEVILCDAAPDRFAELIDMVRAAISKAEGK